MNYMENKHYEMHKRSSVGSGSVLMGADTLVGY